MASADGGAPPKSLEDFLGWAKSEWGRDLSHPSEKLGYKANALLVEAAIRQSSFVATLDDLLEQISTQYLERTGEQLLMSGAKAPPLLQKSHESVVDKLFRENALWNKNWPDAPRKGWIKPELVFEKINDIVRSKLVCRFLDGPAYLAHELKEEAKKLGLDPYYYPQGREEGYYAYHFYSWHEVEVLVGGEPRKVRARYEIQLTTQLQDILSSLTHHYYAAERLSPDQDANGSWKWEYDTPRFRARYLSHTLHMLEAQILDVRDGVSKERKLDD